MVKEKKYKIKISDYKHRFSPRFYQQSSSMDTNSLLSIELNNLIKHSLKMLTTQCTNLSDHNNIYYKQKNIYHRGKIREPLSNSL